MEAGRWQPTQPGKNRKRRGHYVKDKEPSVRQAYKRRHQQDRCVADGVAHWTTFHIFPTSNETSGQEYPDVVLRPWGIWVGSTFGSDGCVSKPPSHPPSCSRVARRSACSSCDPDSSSNRARLEHRQVVAPALEIAKALSGLLPGLYTKFSPNGTSPMQSRSSGTMQVSEPVTRERDRCRSSSTPKLRDFAPASRTADAGEPESDRWRGP